MNCMNRPIKFRAWLNMQEEMLYANIFGAGELFAGRDCQIMQYTGLKDKNGKEIYEGDIVEEYLSDSEDDNYLYSGVIVYFNTEFCLKIKSDTYIKLVNTGDNIEIMGNIYENPELLSGN